MKKFDRDKALRKLRNKNNINIKKASIIVSIFLLIGAIIYFSFARFESSSSFSLINGEISPITDININHIYLGSDEVDSIPDISSGWVYDSSNCSNGASLRWNDKTWNITMNLSSRTECSLYFKEKLRLRGNASSILSSFSDYNSSTDVIDLGASDKLAFDGTSDNNLRFIGDDPKNYILFNNELWRIIGVMNNVQTSGGQSQSLFKIIRADSIGNYSWDSSDSSVNGGYGVNQWGQSTYSDGTVYEGADLMRELNTDYLGNITVGSDGKWFNGTNNRKNADMPTSLLGNEAQSMIEEVVWNLGSPSSNNGVYDSRYRSNLNSYGFYLRERANTNGKTCSSGDYCNDTVVRTSTWAGKVALVYASDYLFAATGESQEDRDLCLNNVLNDWGYNSLASCYKNWLYFNLSSTSVDYYALSPFAYYSYAYYTMAYDKNSADFVYANSAGARRPVVFLKSTVSIKDGFGSADDPYILE